MISYRLQSKTWLCNLGINDAQRGAVRGGNKGKRRGLHASKKDDREKGGAGGENRKENQEICLVWASTFRCTEKREGETSTLFLLSEED